WQCLFLARTGAGDPLAHLSLLAPDVFYRICLSSGYSLADYGLSDLAHARHHRHPVTNRDTDERCSADPAALATALRYVYLSVRRKRHAHGRFRSQSGAYLYPCRAAGWPGGRPALPGTAAIAGAASNRAAICLSGACSLLPALLRGPGACGAGG